MTPERLAEIKARDAAAWVETDAGLSVTASQSVVDRHFLLDALDSTDATIRERYEVEKALRARLAEQEAALHELSGESQDAGWVTDPQPIVLGRELSDYPAAVSKALADRDVVLAHLLDLAERVCNEPDFDRAGAFAMAMAVRTTRLVRREGNDG